jgi:parvulin-like peptidyl-prolyl isomerase
MQKRVTLFILLAMLFWNVSEPVLAVPAHTSNQEEIRIPETVAKVNGVAVGSNFVMFEFSRMMKNVKEPLTLEQKKSIVREIIDTEVVRELMYQEGKVEKLQIASEKIDEEFGNLKSGYSSESEFEEALKQRHITVKEIRKSIELDFLARELLDRQVKGKIVIADGDVQKFYDENKERFLRPESYKAQHIFVSIYPPEMLEKQSVEELASKKESLISQAKAKINKVQEELKGGADFAALAKKYSDDAGSSDKGGDLDFVYKGIFDPAFDETVSKLKAGEVSDIVTTAYGFHIIKLNDTRPAEYAAFNEVKEPIQKYLFMEASKKIAQDYISRLKKKAKVDILF